MKNVGDIITIKTELEPSEKTNKKNTYAYIRIPLPEGWTLKWHYGGVGRIVPDIYRGPPGSNALTVGLKKIKEAL